MADFTPTQARYLSFIKAYMEGFGIAPAESEISEALKVSPPSVNQMIRTLEGKGLISRRKGVPRSIEIRVPLESIPKWQGRAITRTVYQWVRSTGQKQASQRAGRAPTVNGSIYRFRITLRDSQPPIWRELETRDVSLGELHAQIQTSMGWTNSHLHQFFIGDKYYTDGRMLDGDDLAVDYAGIRISDLVTTHGEHLQFEYEYDFGDSWRHDIELKTISDSDAKQTYPRCTSGAGACPPEDVGGIFGFYNFLEAISDPEHDDFLDWIGPFDPEKFGPKRATIRTHRGLPS